MNKLFFILLLLVAITSGCKSWHKSANKSDSTIGTSAAKKNDNAVLTAILNETVGGPAGVVISGKMDMQAKKMEEDLGKTAKVERIGEGIKLTFNTQLLFDVNQTELNESNKADLRKFAVTLVDNQGTNMLIAGHTDDLGGETANLILSEKRANAVANQLIAAGVSIKRMKIQGWGENQPSVLNNSEYNRSQNRRVEIAIFANEQMKREAAL